MGKHRIDKYKQIILLNGRENFVMLIVYNYTLNIKHRIAC